MLGWILLLVFSPQISVDTRAQTSGAFALIAEEATSGAKGYEWLSLSTQHVGHRLTGSPGGLRAEREADSLFRSFPGLEVDRLGFSSIAWSRGDLQLTVLAGAAEERVPAVALANTPLDTRVEAPLVNAGNGLPEDLIALGVRAKGSALLINLGLVDPPEGASNLHRSEKAALAITFGAAAVVFVNSVHGGVLLTGTASVDGDLIPIPAVCIASEDGEALRARLASGEGLSVLVQMENRAEPVDAHDIVAELPGSDLAREVIVVGGHLDSWDLASGATDNGIGAFSILDLARCYSALGLHPRRTIRFVLFMGEEQGLLGSQALVEAWHSRGELARVRCMINLDMTGGPTGFSVVGPGGWEAVAKDIMGRMQAQDTSFSADLATRAGLHSDHQPFLLQGVPVMAPLSDLGNDVYGCYHSSCDDIHLVEPARMVDNVRFVGQFLWVMANEDELPGSFNDEELRERLKADGLEEKLRLQGLWRW
jgi:hypothetical protein